MSEEAQNPKAGQGLGVASLVLGIVGVICSFIVCLWWMGVVLGVVGLVLGIISRSQAGKAGAKKSLGTAGMILGIIAVAIALIWFFVVISAATAVGTEGLEEFTKQLEEMNQGN